jgi:DNA polymerase III epsilon subunit-like protein
MRLVFFDTETGGLESHHPMIQIAAVAADYPELVEIDAFQVKIQFDTATANPEALEKNHYDAAVWAKAAVPERMACFQFSEFLREHADMPMVSRAGKSYKVARLVGHNAAAFDMPRVQAWFKKHGQFLPASFQPLDTLQRANWFFLEHPELQRPSLSLTSLVDYFGITAEAESLHDALVDARAAMAVYREILKREREPKPALGNGEAARCTAEGN